MTTSAQIKALFESYLEKNDEQFFTYGMQIAAHEAKLGHGKLAQELRDLLDAARKRYEKHTIKSKTTPLIQPQGDLALLLSASYPNTRLSELVLSDAILFRLNRIIDEQRHIEQIKTHGLEPRRKFIFFGPPGTGKTITAWALAAELHLPLFIIRLEAIFTKFMGETAAKLRIVFDSIQGQRGVYLFDEFDSIGSMRSMSNDVGEIRRVLNSFLQFIDQDTSDSIILSATNHPEILDYALFRRFDDVIEFTLPTKEQIQLVICNKIAGFNEKSLTIETVAEYAEGLSFAEISRACEDAIKEKIIGKINQITTQSLKNMIDERKKYHDKITPKR